MRTGPGRRADRTAGTDRGSLVSVTCQHVASLRHDDLWLSRVTASCPDTPSCAGGRQARPGVRPPGAEGPERRFLADSGSGGRTVPGRAGGPSCTLSRRRHSAAGTAAQSPPQSPPPGRRKSTLTRFAGMQRAMSERSPRRAAVEAHGRRLRAALGDPVSSASCCDVPGSYLGLRPPQPTPALRRPEWQWPHSLSLKRTQGVSTWGSARAGGARDRKAAPVQFQETRPVTLRWRRSPTRGLSRRGPGFCKDGRCVRGVRARLPRGQRGLFQDGGLCPTPLLHAGRRVDGGSRREPGAAAVPRV